MGRSTDALQLVVQEGLRRATGAKEIPCSLLYDDRGSELYEKITELKEYYPFRAEENLLREHALDIAKHIPRETVIVELGCGTARKSTILLSAVQAVHGVCKYVGIDVSASFLQEARANVLQEVRGVSPECLEFVEADYMQGLKKVRALHPNDNLCICWLGSTVGNLVKQDAIQFFRDVHAAVGHRCQIFLCADMWKDTAKLYAAYHDREGVTELFIKNGMRCALRLLGHKTTEEEERNWEYEVIVNDKLRRVEMHLRFKEGLLLEDHNVHIRSGERVLVELSRKFSVGDFNLLANSAGFHIDVAWRDNVWGMQMLIPFKEALVRCWSQTDLFFDKIEDWCEKPIDVRHPYKFYYGHIQAFAKLKLLLNDPQTETDVMFSRGMDPNMVDPTICHPHPKVPLEWPARSEIETYVQTTRAKLLNTLAAGGITPRLLVLALEHEYMHLETLAYMRVQERKSTFQSRLGATKPYSNGTPNGKTSNGVALANVNGVTVNGATKIHVANGTSNGNGKLQFPLANLMVRITPGVATLGANANDGSFMWDNEYPACTVRINEPFWVDRHPVTVAQFLSFIKAGGYNREELWEKNDFALFRRQNTTMPATWSDIDGEYFVHSLDATDHWRSVADTPVFVSLSEADAFCKWVHGRIMTEPEYHRILVSEEASQVEKLRTCGWEWTSSLFQPFQGYIKMEEYPEYSSDFFDGCHYVLKGASPVTHPCMQRDTFRNFYQRQYPFVFAKFRVCRSSAT